MYDRAMGSPRDLRDRPLIRPVSNAARERIDPRFGRIKIDLPDLDEATPADIVPDNVRALGVIYYAAMLEELKLFAVADKVAERFLQGAIAISRGPAGDALYDYVRGQPQRPTAAERSEFYVRAFGFGQATGGQPSNREFNDLWLRFVVAIARRAHPSPPPDSSAVSAQQAHRVARDLAVNLSLHGTGYAHFAAVELDKLVHTITSMLSLGDVVAAYGVRDRWQLVERVSNQYLGGAVSSVRQRTRAQSGAKIIQWLASAAARLNGPVTGEFPNLNDAGDRELVGEVESWLAVEPPPNP